jgi:glutathione synthase/RimK-type ligase-like ATP-grasp enzyme
MILILTHTDGFEPDLVIDILRSRNIQFARLNFDEFPIRKKITINHDIGKPSILIDLNKVRLRISDIGVVWFHELPRFKFDSTVANKNAYAIMLDETTALVDGLWELLSCKWINHPLSINRASNKIYQLQLAQEIGFLIPPTIITNDPKQAINFHIKHKGDIIIKDLNVNAALINGQFFGSFTTLVSQNMLENLSLVKLAPVMLQKYIQKSYEIRITIVGNKIFAAGLDSQLYEISKIDWRRHNLDEVMRNWIVDLPVDISEKCLKLLNSLGLEYGAIDMIVTPQNEFYFLEINTTGAWAWFQKNVGFPISSAFVDLLVSLENNR